MTKEQYDFCNQYREVIELFCISGHYAGGCDALFDYYGMNQQDKGCPSCKSRFFLERMNDIKNYESTL
jgi:hypothetical protein